MRRLLSSAVIGLCFIALPAHAAPLEVSGWLPYWREATSTARALEKLDYLTEVNPFVYGVKSDGTLHTHVDVTGTTWTTLQAEAKRRGVRVVPTVMWSDASAMHRILSNTDSRVALEDAIQAEVELRGFDGVDIDFENRWYETRDHFSTFLKGLQMRFPKKWVMCTIQPRTPLSSQYEYPYPTFATEYADDYVALNKYCDRVRVMAYDQGAIDLTLNASANQAPYVPVSDVRWAEKTVREVLKVIPKRKVSLGVPTYGYEYTVTPLSESGFRYDLQWALNQPYAFELIAEYAVRPQRNAAGELSFAYIPKHESQGDPSAFPPAFQQTQQPATVQAARPGTFNIVWWSDARAIEDKIKLAKRLGLRGISIFKIDGGEDPALWDILPKVR